jgi:hypothetical protein
MAFSWLCVWPAPLEWAPRFSFYAYGLTEIRCQTKSGRLLAQSVNCSVPDAGPGWWDGWTPDVCFLPIAPLVSRHNAQDWTAWWTVDIAPLRKTLPKREKRKERQMEAERRLSASDPECVPETNSLRPSCPHGHTIRKSHPESRRALVYKMDYPRFQTFSLV